MEGGRLPSVVFESCLVRGGSPSFGYSEGESLDGVPCLAWRACVHPLFRKGRKNAFSIKCNEMQEQGIHINIRELSANHQPSLTDVLGEITPYGEDFVASFVNAPMTFLLLISEIKMG